jgi:7-cyano-7-deazaguanine tRNA-ribosyltransferase
MFAGIVENVHGFRKGAIKTKHGVVETPTLWLTVGFRGTDLKIAKNLLMRFRVPCVFTTAYEIYMVRKQTEVSHKGIHGFLGFNGPVMMDSGGFMFRDVESVPISQEEILSFQINCGADISVVLDHALNINGSLLENGKRIQFTINNTRKVAKYIDQTVIVPIIYLWDLRVIEKMINCYEKIYHFPMYGIANFRPFPLKLERWKSMLNMIAIIRRRLKDRILHCFGVGGTLTMYMLIYLGVDSMDSSSWCKKAGFGKIQLPTEGEAFVSKMRPFRKKCKYVNWETYHCKCPICNGHSVDDLKIKLESSKMLRALHNAYLYLNEMAAIRNAIEEGCFDKQISERYNGNFLFKKLLEHLKKIRKRKLQL